MTVRPAWLYAPHGCVQGKTVVYKHVTLNLNLDLN
eukprot:SAG31_NODE_31198_length_371_cov_0.496324_1_plen_34_part_10